MSISEFFFSIIPLIKYHDLSYHIVFPEMVQKMLSAVLFLNKIYLHAQQVKLHGNHVM